MQSPGRREPGWHVGQGTPTSGRHNGPQGRGRFIAVRVHGAQARGPQRWEQCLPLQCTDHSERWGFPPRRDHLGTESPSRRPPSAGCADQRSAQFSRWGLPCPRATVPTGGRRSRASRTTAPIGGARFPVRLGQKVQRQPDSSASCGPNTSRWPGQWLQIAPTRNSPSGSGRFHCAARSSCRSPGARSARSDR